MNSALQDLLKRGLAEPVLSKDVGKGRTENLWNPTKSYGERKVQEMKQRQKIRENTRLEIG